jgi:hypothetical protein
MCGNRWSIVADLGLSETKRGIPYIHVVIPWVRNESYNLLLEDLVRCTLRKRWHDNDIAIGNSNETSTAGLTAEHWTSGVYTGKNVRQLRRARYNVAC